jgi:hypothetical protein
LVTIKRILVCRWVREKRTWLRRRVDDRLVLVWGFVDVMVGDVRAVREGTTGVQCPMKRERGNNSNSTSAWPRDDPIEISSVTQPPA